MRSCMREVLGGEGSGSRQTPDFAVLIQSCNARMTSENVLFVKIEGGVPMQISVL